VLARILKTVQSSVPIPEILGINAFNLESRREIDPEITKEYHKHSHDESIQSIYLEESRPLDMDKLGKFINLVMGELGNQLLRYKGVVYIAGNEKRIVFQGVHTSITSSEDRPWFAGEERKTRIVFIGRHLPRDVLEEGISLCVERLQ
jgi:G3E family GTPase